MIKITIEAPVNVSVLLLAQFQEIELNQSTRTKNIDPTHVLDLVSGPSGQFVLEHIPNEI